MNSDFQFNFIQTLLIWGIPVLFAITVHETAHGYIAAKLGDPTAKMLGRLTLNPVKHVDLIGTVIIPAFTVWIGGFIFGWAKPVPITWRNLKRPRRDMALVALAGPASNLLMAVLWAAVTKAVLLLQEYHFSSGMALETMGKIGIQVNCILAVLNLLPLQPLDGGRIASSLLPGKLSYYFDQLAPYGIIILLLLLITHVLTAVISPPVRFLILLLQGIFGL